MSILTLIGAELAGMTDSAPLPGRATLNRIPGRGLIQTHTLLGLVSPTALTPS